ncbi:beta-glucosidase 44-like isoform X2 [Ziziphus jujuba]|uniref:Beta-glucosidase 44-like isoform X2 n=1 Tax=Ziziphus jujuba TaxID=326968 RepID=A0ABM4A1K9_ZIZJJ|nr:beta-glucosidase 44-like isoform X2 [Ziziphus jujuba]
MRLPILVFGSVLSLCVAYEASEFADTIRLDTGGLSRDKFPTGFTFGTASSAYQVEGMADKDGRGPSVWDEFVKIPGTIADNSTGEVSVDQYNRYKVYFCFEQFGDRVKNWFTFNEPRVSAALGYDNGLFAPGRCSKAFGNCTTGNSATEPYIVTHNVILSHAAAVQRYREKYQQTQKGRIGIILDFVWLEPLTRSKADNYAAQRARDFQVGWYIHPITYGEYPRTMQEIVGDRLPKFTKEQVKMVKGSIDYVGINQYTTYYMYDPHYTTKPKDLGYQQDWNCGFAYEKNGVPIGPRAHSAALYEVPWGMYKALMYIKERYGNPTIIVSENGIK